MSDALLANAGFLPPNSGALPIICRDGAGGAGYGGVMLLKEPEMREVIGLGRRRPTEQDRQAAKTA